MFCIIEEHEKTQPNLKILDFTNDFNEAKEKLIELSKEFIIFEEGLKKLETVWIEEKTNIDILKEGYYLKLEDNMIRIMKKKTIKTTTKNWNTLGITTYESETTKIETIKKNRILEFNENLLKKYLNSLKKTNIISLIQINENGKNTSKLTTNMNLVINELINNGYKPKNGFKSIIKK